LASLRMIYYQEDKIYQYEKLLWAKKSPAEARDF
jgi:hypothetical protein